MPEETVIPVPPALASGSPEACLGEAMRRVLREVAVGGSGWLGDTPVPASPAPARGPTRNGVA